MKILIIGGTRFFGYEAALQLDRDGHEVTVFTRGRREAELPESIQHLIGDRDDESDLQRAANAAEWDIVWDNINRTPDQARTAIRLFHNRCDLFIYTSTLAVYTVCDGIYNPYSERDMERGRPLDEHRGTFPYDYGLDRRTSELLLREAHREHGFPCVSVRLPVVIGPRDYSLRAWAYWRRLVEGGPMILPDGGVDMHRPIYSMDCVQAILRMIEYRDSLALGGAYNFAGREIFSLRRFVEASAEVLDTRAEIVEVPRPALERAGIDPEELSPFSTWGNHIHAIANAAHDLGFDPTPLDEWLRPSIEWHLQHRRDEDPPGWALRERELQLAGRWSELLDSLS